MENKKLINADPNNKDPFKDSDKWEDYLYDYIINRLIPYEKENNVNIKWFAAAHARLQTEITAIAPDFKTFYDTYYRIFLRLIASGMSYWYVYAKSW